MTMEDSETVDRLRAEIEELRAFKNSAGYALFMRDIQETRQGLIEALITLDPTDIAKIGRNQGAVLSYGVLLGAEGNDSFITSMIENRQADIEQLTPTQVKVNREAFMRTGSARV